VLFEGGATFSDSALSPRRSGALGAPIIFGSYGVGNANLPMGVWFRGKNALAFEHLSILSLGNLQGTGKDITIEGCTIGGDTLAINATEDNHINHENSAWTIVDNVIDHTRLSGMLLEGEDFTVSGNTVTNTGLDHAYSYGKHGIYLKAGNALVTNNTITNFSDGGISVRYRNSTLVHNRISGGPIGIAWFQDDSVAGTSRWTENMISQTTEAGIYVSPSDAGGATRESFIISHNTLAPLTGVPMNLHHTTGFYSVLGNIVL
jgi:hypothetical protein